MFSSQQDNNKKMKQEEKGDIMIDRHQLKNVFVSLSYLETKLILSPPRPARTISGLCFLRCFLARQHAFRKSLTAEHRGDDRREGGREGGRRRHLGREPEPHQSPKTPLKNPINPTPERQSPLKNPNVAKQLQKLKIMLLRT